MIDKLNFERMVLHEKECLNILETDETMNLALAAASQMFSNSAPIYLLARFAILFESQPNYIGRASMVALNVISVMYMIVIFVLGFIWGRKTKRCNVNQSGSYQ